MRTSENKHQPKEAEAQAWKINLMTNLLLLFCTSKNWDVGMRFSSVVIFWSKTRAFANSILSEESCLRTYYCAERKQSKLRGDIEWEREGGRKRERDSEWYEVIGWCWKRKQELHVRMCVFYTWGHSWTVSLAGCWTSCPAVREMTGFVPALNNCLLHRRRAKHHESSQTDRNGSNNDIRVITFAMMSLCIKI